jgi:hypothetical protein
MPDTPTPIRHPDAPKADDAALAQASRSHVANSAALQFIAELILKLRGANLSWWTPELLRDTWDAHTRMEWFRERPDIRQRIACSLTGLRPNAARGKQPEFQAALIDSVIDEGDVTVEQFENEFDAVELAAYAPVGEIWHRFRERMPWDRDIPPNQELVAWLIDRLLAGSSTVEGMTRKPILTPYQVRTMIPGEIWHSRIPLDVRVKIDELRLQRERDKPGDPFRASDDLSVATATIIAANIPVGDLLCVFDVAEQETGWSSSRGLPAAAPRPRAQEPARAEPPNGDIKVLEKPAPRPLERPAERPAGKPLERWERMADRVVLEKEGGSADKP